MIRYLSIFSFGLLNFPLPFTTVTVFFLPLQISSRGFPMAKSDEFKLLEMDRLLPCDLKNTSPPALLQYDAYLHWFYNSHRGPAPVASLADTASVVTHSILCLSL